MTDILVVNLNRSDLEPYFPRHLVPQCVPCPRCTVQVGEWCRSTTSPWNTVPFHVDRRRQVEDWTDERGRAALAELSAERARTRADVREVVHRGVSPKAPE